MDLEIGFARGGGKELTFVELYLPGCLDYLFEFP